MGELFREYHLRVFRTAFGILRDQDAAEDVTQQVFVELPQSLARFDERRPLAPWLYRLAVNISLDVSRRRRQHPASLDSALDVPSPDPGPEDVAEGRERREAIQQAIASLDPRQRAAVVLRYYQGLSEAEMAIALGCRRGTVKSRLHYALHALEKALSRTASFAPGLEEQHLETSGRQNHISQQVPGCGR